MGGQEGVGRTDSISVRVSPAVESAALNSLFAAAWPEHTAHDFGPVLAQSLAYLCAYAEDEPLGFVNVAWDGGRHAFLLDPTVHPRYQRRGIGLRLVREAVRVASSRGVAWLHVDFVSELAAFYRAAGFRSTTAGLLQLPVARGPLAP